MYSIVEAQHILEGEGEKIYKIDMSNNQYIEYVCSIMKDNSNILEIGCGDGECCNFLEKKGYELVEMNYRNRMGEIDLVMIDGDVLVFIEVKLTVGDRFGSPEEMINKNKLFIDNAAVPIAATIPIMSSVKRVLSSTHFLISSLRSTYSARAICKSESSIF